MKENNNKGITFELQCSVRTYSHKLNEKVFSLFMSGKTNIFVKEVKEKSFLLGCINESKRCKTIEEFAPIAHLCFSNFIMALNIATLGNFIWNPVGYPFPLYRFIDPQNRERKIKISGVKSKHLTNATKEASSITYEKIAAVQKLRKST